ncbi:MAG: hypothetical protein ACRAVC_06700 [Trichormus sp.]
MRMRGRGAGGRGQACPERSRKACGIASPVGEAAPTLKAQPLSTTRSANAEKGRQGREGKIHFPYTPTHQYHKYISSNWGDRTSNFTPGRSLV